MTEIPAERPDCIAEAALSFGEQHGNTSVLREQLEQIAEICPHNTGESDLCLLGPVEAKIGITAIESSQGRWWLVNQINAIKPDYPGEISGRKIPEHDRSAQCMEYVEDHITVGVSDKEPAIPLQDGQSLPALLYTQAAAKLLGLEAEMRLDVFPHTVTPLDSALVALEKVVCGGLSRGQLGVRATASIDGNNLRITDEIDGLVLHGNNKRPLFNSDGLAVPENKIVLPRFRQRSIDVTLTDEDIQAFSMG